jgi:penicillin-binding protein 1A
LVVAVYIGFDNPRTLGNEETGASVAMPVFINFMKEALKDKPSTPFRVPSSIKFVKIDRTTGRHPTVETPKEKIFFEAFKNNDSVMEADENQSSNDNENSDTQSNNKIQVNEDSNQNVINNKLQENDPKGIY